MDIPGTRLRIDQFRPGAELYALTHFHQDHMAGLKRGWDLGPLVSSPLTARLLQDLYRIRPSLLRTVSAGESINLATRNGPISLSAYDANHCPGSVMFLVQSGSHRSFVTGDFRLNDPIRKLASDLPEVDLLFYDDTYDDPRYDFPSQEASIEAVLEVIREAPRRKTFVGIYNMGKNRILEAIFREFGRPFCVKAEQARIYQLIDQGRLVTTDKRGTNFRAYALGYLSRYFLGEGQPGHDYTVILPTGWSVQRREKRPGYHHIPYSEHCSFSELQEFLGLVKAKRKAPLGLSAASD